MTYKKEHDLETRKAESQKIRTKYPDRIPIIVERDLKSDIVDIDKKKYLVPSDLTMGQFQYVIRKRIKLDSTKALFVFINNTLPPTSSLVGQIYNEKADEDGFLYINYSSENTFGNNC